MTKKEKTRDAVRILRDRYVKDDPKREGSVEAERVNARLARMIYDLRNDAGLTQKELAELIGTTQSVISRLESADYAGHSLSMLNRIAEALEQKMTVVMTAKDPEATELRHAFHLVIQMLRRRHGLSVDALARRVEVDREEILAMERNPAYRPSPLTLHKLCRFYEIPERRMLVLAGAIKEAPQGFAESASRFAAQSESFATLTDEEERALDEFLPVLRQAD
jgi:transcriptional regulator with XRE-family HTH domain